MKKFISRIRKNWIILAGILFFTALKLYVSWEVRSFISGDMRTFLIPWFDSIKSKGGVKALSGQVGNYGVLYQFLISVLTYIPKNPVYLYKLMSIFFDYVLGLVCGAFVWDMEGRNNEAFAKAAVCYCIIIVSPIVQMNSALWGQCDSIHTAFVVLSLYFLNKEKYCFAFVTEGMALSFKLQAVFLLPVFVICLFNKKNVRIWHFFLIPVTMVLTGIPAILKGRHLNSVFIIFISQIGQYKKSFMNCFVLGSIFPAAGENYACIAPVLISTACVFLFVVFLQVIRSRKELDSFGILSLAFVITFGCFLFLPSMHERYNYIAEILGIIIVVVRPKTICLLIPMLLLTMMTYSHYLFDLPIDSYVPYAITNIMVFIAYNMFFLYDTKKGH